MWPEYKTPLLKMAQPAKSGLMWGPIIEKAWAKVKGSYSNADGGLVENGIRFLTGAPVFLLDSQDVTSDAKLDEVYNLL